MRTKDITAGRRISAALRPSEDAIDGSIIENANLIITILKGRQEMGLAAEVGHDAFLSASAGIAALAEARSHVITCHQQLAEIRDRLGYGPRAFGCTLDKLENRTTNAPLSLVQEEAA